MNNIIRQLINNSPEEFLDLIKTYPHHPHKILCLTDAAKIADKDGIWAEFGVHSGKTLKELTNINDIVYGFDSWKGLPEEWNFENPKGAFNTNGVIPFEPNSKMVLVQGWFNESLPKFIEQTSINKISLLHLDADLYSSTKCVLDNFKPFFKGKCIIVFDEFFNYPEWEKHEYKAFKEFIFDMEKNIINIDILSYSATAYHPTSFNIEFKQ